MSVSVSKEELIIFETNTHALVRSHVYARSTAHTLVCFQRRTSNYNYKI